MPDLDKALQKAAQTVIGGFGTNITMRRTTSASYSTATHKVTSTPVDTPIDGRLSDYEAHEIMGRVQVGDRKLTIAAADLTYTPTTEDEVVIGSRIYSIEDMESLLATDEAAVYVMQIRGGAAAGLGGFIWSVDHWTVGVRVESEAKAVVSGGIQLQPGAAPSADATWLNNHWKVISSG